MSSGMGVAGMVTGAAPVKRSLRDRPSTSFAPWRGVGAVPCRGMRPLHVQLLVTDPQREDVITLREALRAAGHVVVDGEVTQLPDGFSPGGRILW